MAKKEKKQVAKVIETTPEEEQAKLEKSLDTIVIERKQGEKPYNEVIEEKRSGIFTTYKKARRKSNIIMAVVVVVFIVSIILATQFTDWGLIVGGCLIGVTLIFLVVHYILTKNLFPNTTKEYIRTFLIETDNYVLNIKDVYDTKLYMEKRYTLSDVLSDRVYKDVVDCVSRNLVEGTYKEKPFQCGELALYKLGAKKHQKEVVFVGKYISFENNYHFEDRYIINIKGEKDTDLPTDIDDLVALSTHNHYVIYGKEGAKLDRDLGKDLINDLKTIDCTGSLVNVNVVLWAGHTAVYLSYDDSIVAIPFDKELNVAAYTQLKKNVSDVLEILLK